MIIINNIKITDNDDKSRLEFLILENDVEKKVFFEVENKYKEYLCYERCDAIIIGLLNYAMREGLNIKSEIPITEELLYNINTYLIPALTKSDSKLTPITIEADTASALNNAGCVGTGLSCGIDSFHAILNNTNTKYNSLNLTHLCINNVGAFNDCYKRAGIEDVKNERYKQSKIVAEKLNLPLIMTDSNFADVFQQSHLLTNSYSSMFAVYCMQKLWKTYYYASVGKSFEHFKLTNNSTQDSANYDLLTLNCFSHNNLRLYSEGGAISRLEKTQNIIDNEIVQQHLHVCISEAFNCSKCSKCMRTILSLYALDKLEFYKNVFDIDYFYKNKSKYLTWLYITYLEKDKIIAPIYKKLEKEVNLAIKFKCYLLLLLRWIFSTKKQYFGNKKYKVITILGFNIKLKAK